MPWSELDPIGENGRRTIFAGEGFTVELVFDCHREPRKLEVRFDERAPAGLDDALRPFARPTVVSPGQLSILDRAGYFRLFRVPAGLRVMLRKEAPLSVVAELVAQIERAATPRACERCESACTAGALSQPDGRFVVDDERCTACLDCVRHHAAPHHAPPDARAEED